MKLTLEDRLSIGSQAPIEYDIPEGGSATIKNLYKPTITREGSSDTRIRGLIQAIDVVIQITEGVIRVTLVKEGDEV